MLNFSRKAAFPGRRWKSDSLIDLGPSDHLQEAHVLAVDDSIIDRKVIEKLLRTTSCKVTAVDSGMRALEFLGLNQTHGSSVVDELKIDLIITDYCMPGMTGYELLKRIKESTTFKETPVVIMSSENVLARIDRCLEEGAEDFILKPVKLADVERLKDYMMREDRSKGREYGINKRKQMHGSDHSSSQPPPLSRSPPSDLSTSSPSSQSPPSTTPSSPSGPLDPITTPSSPSRSPPSDLSTSSPSGPLDTPTSLPKVSDSNQTVSNS